MAIYTRGLDELYNWESGDFEALLLKDSGYSFVRTHDYVSDLVPGTNEVDSSVGYGRVIVPNVARTINDADDQIEYTCDPIDFGALTTGENITAIVIFKQVTDDADSVLVAYTAFDSPVDSADLSPFVVYPQGGLLASVIDAT